MYMLSGFVSLTDAGGLRQGRHAGAHEGGRAGRGPARIAAFAAVTAPGVALLLLGGGSALLRLLLLALLLRRGGKARRRR